MTDQPKRHIAFGPELGWHIANNGFYLDRVLVGIIEGSLLSEPTVRPLAEDPRAERMIRRGFYVTVQELRRQYKEAQAAAKEQARIAERNYQRAVRDALLRKRDEIQNGNAPDEGIHNDDDHDPRQIK